MSIRITWEGAFLAHHSLSRVNREMVMSLAGLRPEWDLSLKSHASDDKRLAPGSARRAKARRRAASSSNANGFTR